MTHSAIELHERIEMSVRTAMTAAMRADPVGIPAAIEELLARQWLDPHSIAFLDKARSLVLGSATALMAVLEAHRPTRSDGAEECQFCGIPAPCWTLRRIAEIVTAYFNGLTPAIDRAEAWRRADAWLHRDSPQQMLVAVEELDDLGYVARSVPHTPPVALLNSDDMLLIVDGRTGRLTRWPRLHPALFAEEYRAYVTREKPDEEGRKG